MLAEARRLLSVVHLPHARLAEATNHAGRAPVDPDRHRATGRPDEALERAECVRAINQALVAVCAYEDAVVAAAYGLDGGDGRRLVDVAADTGKTARSVFNHHWRFLERARQSERLRAAWLEYRSTCSTEEIA